MNKKPDGQIRKDPPGVDNSDVFGVEKIKVQKGDTLSGLADKYSVDVNQFEGYGSGNPDLIYPGEELTLKPRSSVVSSRDVEQKFKNDSSRLGQIDAENQQNFQSDLGSKLKDSGVGTLATQDKGSQTNTGEQNTDTGTGDPVRDAINLEFDTIKEQFASDAEEARVSYSKLFSTSLASVDATLQGTIVGINQIYEQRIQEQKRINNLRIDRTKAYGLGGSGSYVPLMFNDAVSDREEEAANEITSLEAKRQSLIADAKSARNQGEQLLLRSNLEDLEKIDAQLRSNIANAREIAEQEYKQIKDARKEEETARQLEIAKVLEQFSAMAGSFVDDYSGADDATKAQIIEEIAAQTGLQKYQIIGELETKSREQRMSSLEEKKTAQELETEKQQTEATRALAGQRWASAAKSNTDSAKANDPEKAMGGDIPEKFEDEADFQEKQREFVKKHGEDGRKYWDSVFSVDYDTQYLFGDNDGTGASLTAEEARKRYNY